MKTEYWKLGELFSGPGGLAYGALNAKSDDDTLKLSHAWANDFDRDSCNTYINNLCPKEPDSVICSDVRNVDLKSLGKIDAFAYGFPCNSFSSVGEHRGIANEKFGQLYWFGVEVLRYYQPKFFIAENVSGIRSAGSNDFEVILNDMRESGYQLTANLYKAEEYGIPQARHRVIIVGIRDDLRFSFKVPDPKKYARDVSASAALSDIPANAPNNEQKKLSDKVVERLSYIEPGENVWQAEKSGKLPLELQIKTRTKISQIYRKLHPDRPSYTLTASGGGGTAGYHWTNRELTNRERARLQTFPDTYEFVGNYASVRKQIGMAVPCRLSKIVVSAVLNSFRGIEYSSVKANLSE